MRGGSIPLLAWAFLNAVLLAINWIWQGTKINVAMTAFTVLVTVGFAAAFWLLNRDSIKTGEPEHGGDPQAVPRISVGAAAMGVSVTVILYGLVFGKFLMFVGAALLVVSLGRVGRELIWQQRTVAAAKRGQRQP